MFWHKECEICKVYRDQLDLANIRYERLLDQVLKMNQPVTINEPPNEDSKEHIPIKPKYIPWAVQRSMLEQEDRVKAQKLEEYKKQNPNDVIDQLEVELGIKDAC